jgi:hypothetical protein
LVRPGDADDLARALAAVLADPPGASARARRGATSLAATQSQEAVGALAEGILRRG